MHVLNGDAVRTGLEQSGLPGTFTVWADVLHEGPVQDLPDPEFLEMRARFIASLGWEAEADAGATLRGWNDAIAAFREHPEVVLWLEHDLFDQLLLARHLAWFSRQGVGNTALSMICIGEFPGHPNFKGLGELSPEELASLFPRRAPVTAEQRELGEAVWRAFTAPDPRPLEELLHRDTSALPFMKGALLRLLEEFPDVASGLPGTERRILRRIGAGIKHPMELFRAVQLDEERVFMGDTTFWARIEAMSREPHPLVRVSGSPTGGFAHDRVDLTAVGEAVLGGAADWGQLGSGVRWVGGVRLQSPGPRWRWDLQRRRIVDTLAT